MLKSKKRFIAVLTGLLIILVAATATYLFLKDTLSIAPDSAAAKPLSHHQREEIENTLVQLLKTQDAKASLDYLRSAIQSDTALARECHPILHHLGHEAYATYKDFEKTVSYQDGLCNSGYTHGAIEAHFMASDDINTTLQTTCPSQANAVSFTLWQCYHGMGHGVMYVTGKDLAESTTLCETLPSTFARQSCSNGAYMERFIVVSHTGAAAKETSDIDTELCKSQPAPYKPDCYYYSPTAYLERHTNDYTGAFDECRHSAEEAFVAACINGVGGQAMKENVTRPEVARTICEKAPNTYRNTCIEGAIGLLINHHASIAPVEPLCTTTFEKYHRLCRQTLQAWTNYYTS